MNVLVTGGAGYIGSFVVDELINHGYNVTVLDNLSQGHEEAVHPEVEFVLGDIRDMQWLDGLFMHSQFDAVFHLAAETVIAKSVSEPGLFYDVNVRGSLKLLTVMCKYGVNKIIFSSSAAVYGEGSGKPLAEDDECKPINPYGNSKLIFERILKSYADNVGLQYIALRYFNVAGASERIGEDHHPETHLIPCVLKAIVSGMPVKVYGADYDTADGTCLRDYVDVRDVAKANRLALESISKYSGQVYNIGNHPASVLDVIRVAQKVAGGMVMMEGGPRRNGDPAVLVADSRLAGCELGWRQSYCLDAMIRSALKWIKHHPIGYKK